MLSSQQVYTRCIVLFLRAQACIKAFKQPQLLLLRHASVCIRPTQITFFRSPLHSQAMHDSLLCVCIITTPDVWRAATTCFQGVNLTRLVSTSCACVHVHCMCSLQTSDATALCRVVMKLCASHEVSLVPQGPACHLQPMAAQVPPKCVMPEKFE